MEKDNQKTVETRNLACQLSQEERNEKSKKLVGLLEEKRRLEVNSVREIDAHKGAIKAAKEYYNKQISELSGLINELLPAVSSGKEMRDVACLVNYNTPDAGTKRICRTDTGEQWEEDMTEEEKESLLFFPMPKQAEAEELEEAEDLEDAEEEDAEETDPAESCGNCCNEELTEEEKKKAEERSSYIPGIPLICQPGRTYFINGKKYTALAVPEDLLDTACDHCALEKYGCPRKEAHGRDMAFDCIEYDVFFEEEQKEEESICSNCGAINTASGNKIYHVSGDKALCLICLGEKKAKGLKALAELWNDPGNDKLLIRPSFGFGCTEKKRDTTCFRFMTKGHSWGNPIYIPGNYEEAGTQAAEFLQNLLKNVNVQLG